MSILAKKHATRIAGLFNSIAVAETMIASGYDRRVWSTSAGVAATQLLADYGIRAVGVDGHLAAAAEHATTQIERNAARAAL